MAKKKKGNMRNIQTGATVQFLNFLTPDHIIRGKYNTGNNELDITDIPANLNSVITLGQGGGGGSLSNPVLNIQAVNPENSDGSLRLIQLENGILKEDFVTIPANDTLELEAIIPYVDSENAYVLMVEGNPDTFTDLVNCTYEDGLLYITDPSSSASATITF